MKDVAKAAGVSVMTVSRVINNTGTVNDEMAERVRAAARTLAFEPNGVARDLRYGSEQSMVGLVIEDLANPFYSLLAKTVENVAREHDSLLITASSEEDSRRERDVVLELARRRVAGLIVVPAAGSHTFLREQVELGMPTVLVDRLLPDVEADAALIDNFGGARRGTEWLLDRGHTSIAVLGFSDQIYSVAERIRGVKAALGSRGLGPDSLLVRLGALDEQTAAREVSLMLDAENPPTAFFCSNNRMTLGAIAEVAARNAPAEILGFDDVPYANFLPLPVALVTYDIEQLARSAAELLFSRIEGFSGPTRSLTVGTRLEVHRGAAWSDVSSAVARQV